MSLLTSYELRAIELMAPLNIQGPITTEWLQGGLSGSKVIKVNAKEDVYVVRFWNKQWIEYFCQDLACQIIASNAGYGPKVYLSSEEEGVSVMKYHSFEPLTNNQMRLEALSTLIKKIHSGPEVPRGVDRNSYSNSIINEVKETKIVNFALIKEVKDRIFSILKKEARLVTCHRDLHHGNLIYSKGRFLAIDYTWAGMDDPYVDLANISIFHCTNLKEEELLLQLYLERQPILSEIAKLNLMKQLVKIFYGLEFFSIAMPNIKADPCEITKTSNSYKSFGINSSSLQAKEFLHYAISMLGEVIEYSQTERYKMDLKSCK